MTQLNAGGTTPPNVAGAATQSVPLSRRQPIVIGVFGPANALSAMVLMPGGRTKQVRIGERLNGKQVVRIDDDGLILARGGREERLALP